MTARIAGTIASVAAVLATACTHFYEIPIETPIRPKLDVSAFQRVLVAGFIAGGSEEVDANVETTRLLRSQLRSKSDLRVIEADALPLMEVAVRRDTPATSAPITPVVLKEEKDFEPYETLFANVSYWKQIGEEFQQPLIVTGTVMFIPQEQNSRVLRPRETYDQFGRRLTVQEPVYMERRGFMLRPKFVFIDGRTGVVMYQESFTESLYHNANQQTPALSSYFELMDRLIPSFLGTLSSQKIKGTRFLLQ